MHRLADDRVRRRRRRARRRGRVDDPGAVGAAEAVAGVPGRQRHRGVDDAGLAAGQRADAGGVDGLAGRGQRAAGREVRDLPRAAGRVRRPLAQPGRRGLGRRLLRRPGGAGAGRRAAPATRASGRARPPRSWPGSSRRSARTARSPRATPRRSTTARPPCCSARRAPAHASGVDPLARIAGRGHARAGAAGLRLRAGRGGRPGAGPGRHHAGPTWRRSSSTRRSPCSRWPASTRGRSTPRSSTPRAARSRSATRSAPPAAGSSAPWRTGCASPATGGAWPRSASASARRWPSCWRTSS